jgi:D-aminopeptidase
MARTRLRDLGIAIGKMQTGPSNAITDVPGVTVGHSTVISDAPRVARTGVTMILPRGEQTWKGNIFAAYHALNGNGELTGTHWLDETGLLCEPIGITNTYELGIVRDAIVEYIYKQDHTESESWGLPVVAETYDGWLNDIKAFHLRKAHAFEAIENAKSGEVEEGNVGGGTGMICHEFKGGIGTSSRLVEALGVTYTVGVLLQANYGDRDLLRVDGVPVGRLMGKENPPVPWPEPQQGGSIIVIIATDAPLMPIQCKRLAQRATIGLARVGGVGHNGSGDIFLAFSTGNHIPFSSDEALDLEMLPNHHMNPLFEAVAEGVEEAILNALTAAETMTGFKGRTAHAIPLDRLKREMATYQRWATG